MSFILTVVIGWTYRKFIYPIFDGVLSAGELLVDSIVIVFLGTDRQLAADGGLGFADLPLYFADVITDAAGIPVASVFTFITDFNQSVATMAMSAGLAGPPIVAFLAIIEIAAVLYVLWAAVEALQLGPYLDIILEPIRKAVSFLR